MTPQNALLQIATHLTEPATVAEIAQQFFAENGAAESVFAREDLRRADQSSQHPFYQILARAKQYPVKCYYYFCPDGVYLIAATGLPNLSHLVLFAYNQHHVYLDHLWFDVFHVKTLKKLKTLDVERLVNTHNDLYAGTVAQSRYLAEICVDDNCTSKEKSDFSRELADWQPVFAPDLSIEELLNVLLSATKPVDASQLLKGQQLSAKWRMCPVVRLTAEFPHFDLSSKLAIAQQLQLDNVYPREQVIKRLAVNLLLKQPKAVYTELNQLGLNKERDFTAFALQYLYKKLSRDLPKTSALQITTNDWLALFPESINLSPEFPQTLNWLTTLWTTWLSARHEILVQAKQSLANFFAW